MRATFRWVRGDLLTRRGQALLTVLVVSGVVAALVLAVTALQGATNPWQGLFARTRGAHVTLLLAPSTGTRELAHLHGVTAIAGPDQAAAASLVRGSVKASVELRAMKPRLRAVDSPLVRQGQWLGSASPRGVVLETSFAEALHIGVGTRIVIESLDGISVRAYVTGIADTADQGFYPQQTPGLVWVLPALLKRVESVPTHTQEAVGLRLADPSAAGFVAQQAVDAVGEGRVISVSTWQDVQQSMALDNRLLGLLFAVFGLAALGAAALAIGNATGGRVLVQLQDIAMLKTLGFTPGQVVRMLVAEHSALGAIHPPAQRSTHHRRLGRADGDDHHRPWMPVHTEQLYRAPAENWPGRGSDRPPWRSRRCPNAAPDRDGPTSVRLLPGVQSAGPGTRCNNLHRHRGHGYLSQPIPLRRCGRAPLPRRQ